MAEVVFINYRRDDAGAEAILVASALRNILGDDSVFMDSSSIQPGATWPNRIRSALTEASCFLVIIGPDWLRAGMNEWGQRRIDDEADWARQEIAMALRDDTKTIIPLLVRGARLPPVNALPEDVCGICLQQAVELRRDFWHHDIQLLITRICPTATCDASRSLRPLASPIPANPLLASVWDLLAPDLQDAFALAANAARREGKDIISTHTLFAALRRLHPGKLSEFFDQIPADAMPEPTPNAVPMGEGDLAEIRQLSSCVQDSLSSLASRTINDNKLTSEDVFVDIAKHGRGTSVARLRTHGVDLEKIDQIVKQLGWSVTERISPLVLTVVRHPI